MAFTKVAACFRQFVNRPMRFAVPIRNYTVDVDGDMYHQRTTVSFIGEDSEDGVFVDTYSSLGFRLTSGIRVMGPCAVFPRTVLQWNVQGVNDISEESLSLFTMLEPKIDILVIGVGERENLAKVKPEIVRYLRQKKINVELLSTDQALATFNFLNAEKRYVAGAFIPPSYVDMYEDDDINSGVPEGVDPHEMPKLEAQTRDDDIDFKPFIEQQKKETEDNRRRRTETDKGDDKYY